MVDNFAYFERLLPFDGGEKYLVYLHRRGKENPELTDDTVDYGNPDVLKGWWLIGSAAELEDLRETLIEMSREYNARVCLKPNRVVVEDLKDESFTSMLCTQRLSENLYIIDCDAPDLGDIPAIKEIIRQSPWGADALLYEAPTPNGVHLITKPFHLGTFRQKYPNVHIRTNRATVLYFDKK